MLTKVVNDGEGELATGNVVIYALIDGNARAQLAATETVKITTVLPLMVTLLLVVLVPA